MAVLIIFFFFFSSRRRHTRCYRDWSSDVCSSDLPGEPAVRIDLNPSARPPEGATVTVSAATASPGEHLLHAIAARLLAAPPAIPPDTRLHPAAPGPGPVTTAADGLGDVIAALQAV